MTKEEAVILSAYTGYLLVPDFADVHAFVEKLLGRPVWTHEFADRALLKEIQGKCKSLLPAVSKEAPAADAEPVVHGRWIRTGNKNECDQCGFFYYSSRADYRHCPMCGAKMDLKEVLHGE